jgi:hypothetical protein
MKKSPTVFLIAFVFLTGLVLIPFVGVHGQVFRWQNYVGVYEDTALVLNHVLGAPGSYFHVSGSGFSPNAAASVSVNGVPLGNVATDAAGELAFNLNTNSANLGRYEIVVEQGGDSAVGVFFLVRFGEVHPLTGADPIFNVPPGIGEQILYLPFIGRK